MDLPLVFLTCLYLVTRLVTVSCMPAHHHKHGVLDSIVHCDNEQRSHILHQLEHRFQKELQSADMSLPPKTTNVKVFFSVTYYVTDSVVSEFVVHGSELESEGNIPSWKIHKASVRVTGRYKYSYAFGSDSGTYELKMDDVRMHLIGKKCQIDLGQPNKVFSGSTADWGYNTYIKGTPKDDDNQEVKEKLCHYGKQIYQEVLSKAACHPKTTMTTTTTTTATTTTTTTTTLAPTEVPKEIVSLDDPESEVNEDSKEQPLSDSPSVESVESRVPESHVPSQQLDKEKEEELHPLPEHSKSHIPSMSAAVPTKKVKYPAYYDDSFSNDEPLVVPGFLPFVDPDEKYQSKGSAVRNSSTMIVTVILTILMRCFVMN